MARASKALLVLFVLALLSATVVGCSGGADSNQAKIGGTVTWRIPGDVSNFNPLLVADGTSQTIADFCRERLGGIDRDGKWVGALATEYKVSEDGLTYTFTLRKGVKWADGKPFTADDVVFTYNLIMNPDAGCPVRARLLIGGKPLKWEKVDDYTVKMVVPEKIATSMESLISFYPVPKHLLESVAPKDLKTCAYSQNPVLTGPFKLAEYKTGEYVKLVRNDSYWGGKPYLDQVVIRIIPDEAAAVVALESGQIDVSGVSPETAKRLKSGDKVAVYTGAGSGVTFLNLNNKVFPFDDPKVRQAMNHAVNRDEICSKLYLGFATPAYSFMVPRDLYYDASVVTKYAFDLEKAKALLSEAGFKAGANGILEKGGKKLEFEVQYLQGSVITEQMLLLIQSDLAKVGVKMSPRVVESSAYVRMITAGTDPLPFQATLNSMSPGPEPDNYAIVYHGSQYPAGKNGYNYVGYINKRVDELFDLGKRELDPAKRKVTYSEIQKIISADAAIVPIVYPGSISAASKKLQLDAAQMGPNATSRFLLPAKLSVSK